MHVWLSVAIYAYVRVFNVICVCNANMCGSVLMTCMHLIARNIKTKSQYLYVINIVFVIVIVVVDNRAKLNNNSVELIKPAIGIHSCVCDKQQSNQEKVNFYRRSTKIKQRKNVNRFNNSNVIVFTNIDTVSESRKYFSVRRFAVTISSNVVSTYKTVVIFHCTIQLKIHHACTFSFSMSRIRVLVNTVAANNKEHNITVVSLKKDESAPVNVHYILLEDVYDSIYDGSDVMDWVAANDAAVYDEIQQCTEFCVKSCNGKYKLVRHLNFGFQFCLCIWGRVMGYNSVHPDKWISTDFKLSIVV